MDELIRVRLIGYLGRPAFMVRQQPRRIGRAGLRPSVTQDELVSLHAWFRIPRRDIDAVVVARQAADRARGAVNKAVAAHAHGGLSPFDAEWQGAAAECAASRWLGQPVRTHAPDLGWDFLHDGRTLDVKGTAHRDGVLYFPSLAAFKADEAALGVIA
jgi:hypothetical protein